MLPCTDVVKEPVFVACGLDAPSHDQTPDGEIVQLRHDRESPAPTDEEVVELSNGDHGLNGHGAPGLVHAQDVGHVDAIG